MRPAFRALIEAIKQHKQSPSPGPDINWPITGGAAAAGLLSNSAMHAKEARRGTYMLKSPRISKVLASNIRKEMVHDVKYAKRLKLGALGVGAGTLGIYLADKYGRNRSKKK